MRNTDIPTKSIAFIFAPILSITVLVWFNQDSFWALIDLVRDRETVVAYLDPLGFIGPLDLSVLLGLQVLIPTLPSEPMMITDAYAYGLLSGFLISWLFSVAANQAVFYLARFAGRLVAERFVLGRVLEKSMRATGEKTPSSYLWPL